MYKLFVYKNNRFDKRVTFFADTDIFWDKILK